MMKILTMCMVMCVLCGTMLAASKPIQGQNFSVPLGVSMNYQWKKNGSNISGATNSSYTISKVKKSDEGSYWVTVSDGSTSVTSKAAKLTLSTLSIKMHQVSDSRGYQNATSSAGADEPLIPLASETSLGSHLKEVSQGLVADGVTPLVFSVKETGQTTEDHIYTIKLVPKATGSFSYNKELYVLDNGWYFQSTLLPIKAHPQGDFTTYFYLKGVKSEDIPTFVSEESYSIEITSGTGSEALATQEFKIRRPPIVLVHGFNSDGKDWKDGFKNALYYSRPKDFVYDLKYGFDSNGGNYPNTYWSLRYLVYVLNEELKKNVEGKSGGKVFWDGWACSQYDMVCHSQGGVLTRMLCSQSAVWGNNVPAYRNADNNYRGRFHRVVTIGSPQNGASILYYMIQMRDKGKAKYHIPNLPVLKDLYQKKFDPWGPQLKDVNSKPIDPAAKFHSVRCYVDGISPAHRALGLGRKMNGKTGEEIVHPYGSDGVVDMVSQMAGGTSGSLYSAAQVCHSPVGDLFGTPYGETFSDFMGVYARQLLDGSASNFGSFKMPAAASTSWKAEIDRFVDYNANAELIQDVVKLTKTVMSDPYTYRKLYMTLEPYFGRDKSVYAASDGIDYNWFAEVYGPDGVTTVGVTVEPDPDDPMGVIVTIDNSVIGDVVLYMDYQAENEKIYAIEPTVIYSNQPGTSISSIKLEPSELTMTVGDVFEPELWVTYSNQQSSQLYIGNGTDVTFTSSNPKVVKVEGYLLKALSAGTAVITAKYKGKTCTARYTVESSNYEEEGEFIGYEVNNDKLTIIFDGFLYESSNGVNGWKFVTSQSPYTVKMSNWKKFYRSCSEKVGEEESNDFSIPLSGNTYLDMIWIEPGTFLMGSPVNEIGRNASEVQHRVTLTRGYWLGKYEVTQGQYQAVMGENPAKETCGYLNTDYGIGNNYPVYFVSRDDAMAFCVKLTEIERKAGRLSAGYEYTLPTEAQWEYACRAGTTTAFNNGTNIPTDEQITGACSNLYPIAWYGYNAEKTHPVGQKSPNAWGLYDMHGNVYEWCLDRYDNNSTTPVTDPVGTSDLARLVIRGGCWNDYANNCRSAYRSYYAPNGVVGYANGFRVALVSVK